MSEESVRLWENGYQDGFNSDLGPDEWDFERDPRRYNHPTFKLGKNRGRAAIGLLVEQAFYDCYDMEIDADNRDWEEY